jgi:hypothetical protein
MLIDNIDLLMVVPFKDADSDKLIFGEKAFDTLEITIFWLPEKARPVTDIVQLREKRLITIAGYSYGGVFKGEGDLVNAELFLSESHPQALKALNLGRAPYLLAYKKAVQFYSEDDTEVSLRSFNFKWNDIAIYTQNLSYLRLFISASVPAIKRITLPLCLNITSTDNILTARVNSGLRK